MREEIKQKAMELQLMKGFENLLVQRVIGILSAYAAKFGEALGDLPSCSAMLGQAGYGLQG